PALHSQSPLPADRHRAIVSRQQQPLPMDERDDRPEEGEELLRDAGHRIPDRRSAVLGLSLERALRRARRQPAPVIEECKAEPDYSLWLLFDDGLEGWVYLGNLVEIVDF